MFQVRKFPISRVKGLEELNIFLAENDGNIKKIRIVKEDIDQTDFTIAYVIYETNECRSIKV